MGGCNVLELTEEPPNRDGSKLGVGKLDDPRGTLKICLGSGTSPSHENPCEPGAKDAGCNVVCSPAL